jgi:hypothetical protein
MKMEVLSNMKKQLLFNEKKGKVTRSLLTFTDPQYRFILLRAEKESSNDAVEEGVATPLSSVNFWHHHY